jgi:lysozyme
VTTPYLVVDLSRDEGLRLKAYPDPLSSLAKAARLGMTRLHGLSGDPWTCGYGCTGPDIHEDTIWTEAEARRRRDAKIAEAKADLDRSAPWWRSLCDARQDVLVNMTYNMGWPRLSGFKRALAAMQAHAYEAAAREMLDSAWAAQVGPRAHRLAEQMRTGVRA